MHQVVGGMLCPKCGVTARKSADSLLQDHGLLSDNNDTYFSHGIGVRTALQSAELKILNREDPEGHPPLRYTLRRDCCGRVRETHGGRPLWLLFPASMHQLLSELLRAIAAMLCNASTQLLNFSEVQELRGRSHTLSQRSRKGPCI